MKRFRPLKGGIDRSVSLPHEVEVELYSNSFSHCSRKVRLVLAELGIGYKHHPIDLIETGAYQTVSREYLLVNPAGLVPTLIHEGHPVFESDDILEYAQTIAPENAPDLVPADSGLQTQMHDWLSFCAIVSADLLGGMKQRAGSCIPGLTMPIFMTSIQYVPLHKIVRGFVLHFTVKSPFLFTCFKLLGLRTMLKLKPFRELIHRSRDHMLDHLMTINQTLKAHGQSWILGETYSLADVSIGCMLLRLEETGWLNWFMEQRDLSELAGYYGQIKSRPAWSAAIIAHAHPIVTQASQDLHDLAAFDPGTYELIYGSTPAAAIHNVLSRGVQA